MIYKKISINFKSRDYQLIIRQIDEALELLHDALVKDVFENNKTGYKLNTGQSDVSVTIDTSKDAIGNIERLEKLRDYYLTKRQTDIAGRVIRLRDQNNFR